VYTPAQIRECIYVHCSRYQNTTKRLKILNALSPTLSPDTSISISYVGGAFQKVMTSLPRVVVPHVPYLYCLSHLSLICNCRERQGQDGTVSKQIAGKINFGWLLKNLFWGEEVSFMVVWDFLIKLSDIACRTAKQ
jgi:hypothetical protein